MEFVNLYTRQHENSIYELESKGIITNKKLYVQLHMSDIAPFFLERYDYFVKMAERFVPRNNISEYPIWCSVSKKNCLKPIDKEVVYAIRVPKDEVIYFDGGRWDLVLNNQYIPKDAADAEDFYRLLKSYGLSHTFDIFDRKYTGAFDDVKARIRDSWKRIFEITDRSEFVVQANLWCIKKGMGKAYYPPWRRFLQDCRGYGRDLGEVISSDKFLKILKEKNS